MAQYLQLIHAHEHPEVLDQNTLQALTRLERAGLLDATAAGTLIPAARLINNLTQILRLSLDTEFQPESAPQGLKALLASVGEVPGFANLEAGLRATLTETAALFDHVIV